MIDMRSRFVHCSFITATKSWSRLSPIFLALALGAMGASERCWERVSICKAAGDLVVVCNFVHALVMCPEGPKVVTA